MVSIVGKNTHKVMEGYDMLPSGSFKANKLLELGTTYPTG